MPPNVHITNTDRLPLRKLPNGNWQLRKRIAGGSRVEVMLGTTDRDVAEERARKILGAHCDDVLHATWADTVNAGARNKGWLWRMHYNMTTRAKAKGIEDTITLEALRAVALRSAGKCEVSGVAFYMGHLTRHPFQASIDRIDSSRGYEITNVRFVCLSVNMCMAQWGASVFHTIAAATVAKRLRDLSKDGEEWARNGENNFPEESPIVVTT